MNLSLQTKRNTEEEIVLVVGGEVDAFTAPQLKGSLDQLVQEATMNQVISLDVGQVSYMDSTGVGVLIGALKTCKAKGVQLVLKNVPPRIERLLKITGLTEVMLVVPAGGEKP